MVVVASRDPFDRFRMAEWLDNFSFVHLGLLDPAESLKLLAQMTGAEVIERESTAARRVVGYCSGLPLALGIAGTRITRAAEVSAEPVAEIARQFASGGALDVLHEKDPKTNLRVIFGSSVDRLDEPVRRMFYRLGLRLATGIDAHAVALLGETTIGAAYRAIRDFDSVGLIELDGGRFHVHDLLHDFAAERVMSEGDALTAAPKRVIEHALQTYCACVNYEFDRVNPNNVMVDRAALDGWLGHEDRRVVDDYGPGEWVRAERENLVSFVKSGCADYPPFAAAPRLAYALFYSLESTGYWTDWEGNHRGRS